MNGRQREFRSRRPTKLRFNIGVPAVEAGSGEFETLTSPLSTSRRFLLILSLLDKGINGGLGDLGVIFSGSARDADSADDLSIDVDRNAAFEGCDFGAADRGGVFKRQAQLGVGRAGGGQGARGLAEGCGRCRLGHRGDGACGSGPVHAEEDERMAAFVDDGDVHLEIEVDGFRLGNGGDALRACERESSLTSNDEFAGFRACRHGSPAAEAGGGGPAAVEDLVQCRDCFFKACVIAFAAEFFGKGVAHFAPGLLVDPRGTCARRGDRRSCVRPWRSG